MTPQRSLRGILFLVLLFSSVSSIARNFIRVDKTQTRLTFGEKDARLSLAVAGDFTRDVPVHIRLEFVNVEGKVVEDISRDSVLARGAKQLDIALAEFPSRMKEWNDTDSIWTRLRYQLTAKPDGQEPVETRGVVAVSEIRAQSFVLTIGKPFQAARGTRCRIYVFAQRPGSKQPVSNVRIEGTLTISDDSGERTLEPTGRTSASGYAPLDFDIPANLDDPHIELQVKAALSGFVRETTEEIELAEQAELILTSDKPIYQPGQYLRFRVLAFDALRRALAKTPVKLSVKDPEDSTVFRVESTTSQFGEADAEWLIPDNARLGDYSIEVERGDSRSSVSQPVKISRYELPTFTVTPKPDRPYYLPNQDAQVEVRADYLFQAHVRVVRETEREWNYHEQKWETKEGQVIEGALDAAGRFLAKIDLKDEHDEFKGSSYERYSDLQYSAYVTDSTSNRTEQRRFDIRISKEPIHIYVIDKENAYGLPLEFYLSTFYADGKPAKSSVTIYESINGRDQLLKTVPTNRYGVAKVTGLRSDAIELKFAAEDVKGARGQQTESFYRRTSTIGVYSNKTIYRRGEPLELSVQSTKMSGPTILEVRRDATMLFSRVLQLRNGKTFVMVLSLANS